METKESLESLDEQLKRAVGNIGERIEQECGFPKLAVTSISEIGKNSVEIAEEIINTGIFKGMFDILLLVKEKELLKMRKKKMIVFRSKIVPDMLLRVIVDNQKIICDIYDTAIPIGIVSEEIEKFVQSREEVKEFVISKCYNSR